MIYTSNQSKGDITFPGLSATVLHQAKDNMPDVSIIIPTWNAAAFIGKAITSALRQTGVAVEVVVNDDASTDQTAAVIAAFHDPRVRSLRLTANGGPAAARNAALTVARGKWIAVLDTDDTMLPDRLHRLVGIAEANRLDIIADNLWVVRVGKAGADWSLLDPDALDGRLMWLDLAGYLFGNGLFSGRLGYGYLKPLFRRSFLDHHAIHYDETLRIAEDFHFVLDALALGARCARHASAGYVYAMRGGSTSHRLSFANAAAMIEADRRFLARFRLRLSPAEVRAGEAHLRSLIEGAAFIVMVDSIKQRRVFDLIRAAGRHPKAVRHFSMPIRAALARLRRVAA